MRKLFFSFIFVLSLLCAFSPVYTFASDIATEGDEITDNEDKTPTPTPPASDSGESNKYLDIHIDNLDDVMGYFKSIKSFLDGLSSFFLNFHDIFAVLFPFLSVNEVNNIVAILLSFIGLLLYLLIRRLTI